MEALMLTRRSLSVATALALTVGLLAVARAADAAGDPHSAAGTVFWPNPVQQLGNESLTDNKDADDPAFAAAYRRVILTHLDGSGTLTGDYVAVKSSTGKAAVTVGGAFPAFHRNVDQFE